MNNSNPPQNKSTIELVIKNCYADVPKCMSKDQHLIAKKIQRLRIKNAEQKNCVAELNKVEQLISRSKQQKQLRSERIPIVNIVEDLPIFSKAEEIKKALQENQIVIIAGETGSGKTTQIPKLCLQAGLGISGYIAHTQPRRIAARSIANRLAQELKSEVGKHVGYKVRFTDQVTPQSYVKLMTDGILLAEIRSDRYLNQYDCIIIDEAHERSLNIDFLLGYLKWLVPKRPELKLIITSATIDTQRFSEHFNQAPVIEVSGRSYPVEQHYRPVEDASGNEKELSVAVIHTIDEIYTTQKAGDILVFLCGEREIRETTDALKRHHLPNTELLPLFSRLGVKDQNKVFCSGSKRRIVLSTNVAETSLTVPGIRYVIDTGTARINRFNYRTKMQRLPIEAISQSSANQRKGRCGRVAEGACYRLYSEDEFNQRPEFTEPEILRTNLASVILNMGSLRIGSINDFPFIDPPNHRFINAGYKLLHELGAIDDNNKITKVGKQLSYYPLDPRISRMLIEAEKESALREVLIIASALSVQDPRERPLNQEKKADLQHQKYNDDQSDFLFFLNLWVDLEDKQRHLSNNQFRKFCQKNYISYRRFREWKDIYSQLNTLIKQKGITFSQETPSYAQIHRSILSGLLSNIGFKQDKVEYKGPRDSTFYVFPGSGLCKKSPKWVMASEIVETSRVYARNIARIEPHWVEKLAQNLVKKTYSGVVWNRKRAQVLANENVSLYGLSIIPKRKIHYGTIDQQLSRELFIKSALVERQFDTKESFFLNNEKLIQTAEKLEAKCRRRDILVDDQTLYELYEKKIPQNIYSGASFHTWVKQLSKLEKDNLILRREQITRSHTNTVEEDQFPDNIIVDDAAIRLNYHFDPTHDHDGVNAVIPLVLLNHLDETIFEWLVPGLLLEKIIVLIKCLPKNVRKNFVPAPQYAELCLNNMMVGKGDLLTSLAKQLKKINASVNILPSDWNIDNIPNYYLMNYHIQDQYGVIIDSGRNFKILKQKHYDSISNAKQSFPKHDIEIQDVKEWSFANLPQQVVLEQNSISLVQYPAIVDNGESVSIQLFDDEKMAANNLRQGLIRLFILDSQKNIKYLRKNIPNLEKMCLLFVSIASCEELKKDIEKTVVNNCLFLTDELIYTRIEFEKCAQLARENLLLELNRVANAVFEALQIYQNIMLKLDTESLLDETKKDILYQLSSLVFSGFVSNTSKAWLFQLPRLLKGIDYRIQRINQSPLLDKERLSKLQRYIDIFDNTYREYEMFDELEHFKWMIEEMRISLFSQELKTSIPISFKRLDDQSILVKGTILN